MVEEGGHQGEESSKKQRHLRRIQPGSRSEEHHPIFSIRKAFADALRSQGLNEEEVAAALMEQFLAELHQESQDTPTPLSHLLGTNEHRGDSNSLSYDPSNIRWRAKSQYKSRHRRDTRNQKEK